MDEGEDFINLLQTKHRKEKKELQARVQALKKSVKNDKTKKKDLSAEIAKLELELEDRHRQEVAAAEEVSHSSESADVSAKQKDKQEIPKVKISKAQKRRDKKTLQEKERAEQIQIQEKENVHGPRNKEIEAVNAKLKAKELQIFSIPSDGDCLYKAISHQMLLSRQNTISVNELRKSVALYMKDNKDDFLPFMSNPDTCEMLTDEEFEEYCEKTSNTKVWGGQLEIRALSNYLKCPINVIQATGPDTIEQGSEFSGPPLTITYHRHMYSLGEHYNSTQKAEDSDEENVEEILNGC